MKYFIIFILFINFQLYAIEKECLTESDVAIVKKIMHLNEKEKLKAIASGNAKKNVLNNKLFNDERSILSNISEISYEWGGDERPKHASARFPASNICVWNLSLTLPESMRMKCDDDGAYGYFIQFKKVNGNMVMYTFSSDFILLSNGTLACKAANDFMFSKKK